MKKDNIWQDIFDVQITLSDFWFMFLIINLIIYFIFKNKTMMIITFCSVFFFIKNMVIAYFAYVKKDNKDDK